MKQITIDREGAQAIGDMLITGHPQAVDQICNAFLAAAAGDFAPLAELVGTREVKRNATTDRTACVMCGARTAALIGAERLADACEAAVKLGPVRGGLDARSPIADALLDYRDPAEAKVATAPAPAPGFREGDVVAHRERGPGWVVTLSQWSPPLGFALNLKRGADSHYAAAALCTLTHRRHFKAGERCATVAVGQSLMTRGGLSISIIGHDGDAGWFGSWSNGGPPIRTYIQADDASQMPLAADWSAPEAVPCEVGA